MTPHEKAKELFYKMSFETHKYNAKHCASTAVDEIINTVLNDWGDYQFIVTGYIEYWQEVKQEIEKL